MDDEGILKVMLAPELWPEMRKVIKIYYNIPVEKRDDIAVSVRKEIREKKEYSNDDLLLRPCCSKMISNKITGSAKLRNVTETHGTWKLLLLPEVHFQMFTVIMDFMYSGALMIRIDDITELIDAAIFLEMDELIGRCFMALSAQVTPEKALLYCRAANRYKDKDLPDFCKKTIDQLTKTCALITNTFTGNITQENVFAFFEASVEFEAQQLQDRCLNIISTLEISSQTVDKLLIRSKRYRKHYNSDLLLPLEIRCNNFMYEAIAKTSKFAALNFDGIRDLSYLAIDERVEHSIVNTVACKWVEYFIDAKVRNDKKLAKKSVHWRKHPALRKEHGELKKELLEFIHSNFLQ